QTIDHARPLRGYLQHQIRRARNMLGFYNGEAILRYEHNIRIEPRVSIQHNVAGSYQHLAEVVLFHMVRQPPEKTASPPLMFHIGCCGLDDLSIDQLVPVGVWWNLPKVIGDLESCGCRRHVA